MARSTSMNGSWIAFPGWRAVAVLLSAWGIFGASYATSASFPVFDAMVYKNKPDPRALGMTPIRPLERFWAPGEPNDQVDAIGTRREAAKMADYQGAVFIDIEHWPVYDVPQGVAEQSIAKLARVASIVRGALPRCRIGFYDIMPQSIYWPIVNRDEKQLRLWHESNQRTERLASGVNFICPSLYTFYADEKGWELCARTALREARRYGKPVYPFLWPEYHVSNARLRDTYLPAHAWRRELEICRELADGIVIWGGWQREWDENAPWWTETKIFLRTANRRDTSEPRVDAGAPGAGSLGRLARSAGIFPCACLRQGYDSGAGEGDLPL